MSENMLVSLRHVGRQSLFSLNRALARCFPLFSVFYAKLSYLSSQPPIDQAGRVVLISISVSENTSNTAKMLVSLSARLPVCALTQYYMIY